MHKYSNRPNYQKLVINTFNLITASTASLPKCSLSCERILELKVVIAIFIKSDLNFSAIQCVTLH